MKSLNCSRVAFSSCQRFSSNLRKMGWWGTLGSAVRVLISANAPIVSSFTMKHALENEHTSPELSVSRHLHSCEKGYFRHQTFHIVPYTAKIHSASASTFIPLPLPRRVNPALTARLGSHQPSLGSSASAQARYRRGRWRYCRNHPRSGLQ